MAVGALVKEYLNLAKLSKDASNAEVVVDGVLTHFGLDFYGQKLGAEKLYTMGIVDYKFRSVLSKGEDLTAICDWFKNKLGLTDEEIAEGTYVNNMMAMADKFLGMGHVISGKKYLELAASKGCPKAAARLKDFIYAQNMYTLGEQYEAMGHKFSSRKYFELAAAKGCPKAAAKL